MFITSTFYAEVIKATIITMILILKAIPWQIYALMFASWILESR